MYKHVILTNVLMQALHDTSGQQVVDAMPFTFNTPIRLEGDITRVSPQAFTFMADGETYRVTVERTRPTS